MLTRAALDTDLDQILPMMEEFNRGEKIDLARDRLAPALSRLLADAALGRVLVLEEASVLVGYAVVTWGFDLEFGGRDAFLTEIFVRADRRKKGAGRALLDELLRVAREAGAGAIHLGVYPTNAAALALYRSLGFARIPRDFYTRSL
jgi:ribosomal protein S18 acetylase RimI-like enzyme